MAESPITVTRSELYRQVWSATMISLAKKYGLSDNSLRKICRKHNIPTPEAGHWAKQGHGHPTKSPPLRNPDHEDITLAKMRWRNAQLIVAGLWRCNWWLGSESN